MLTKNDKYNVLIEGKLVTYPKDTKMSLEGQITIKNKKQPVKIKGYIYTDPKLPNRKSYDVTIKGVLFENSFSHQDSDIYNVYIDGKMTVNGILSTQKDYRVNIEGEMELE
jgi:hypothetical protein